MTDEPRILTDDESYSRRREHASGMGPKTIELCAWKNCDRPAFNGPLCPTHRQPQLTNVIAAELTPTEITDLQQQVEADAAPLFVLAMNWLAGQQLARLGITTDSLAAGIERIRGELEAGTS